MTRSPCSGRGNLVTTEELLDKIIPAIRDNAELTEWCQTLYGKPPMILVGVDERNAPDDSDYPVITILDVSEDRSVGDSTTDWSVLLEMGLLDDGVSSYGVPAVEGEDAPPVRVREFLGVRRVNTFREMVETSIHAARIGKGKTSGESFGAQAHPLYLSYSVFTLSIPKDYRRGLA